LRNAAGSWAIASDDWRLQLALVPAGLAGSAPVVAASPEICAAVADDGQWLIETRVSLFQDSDAAWQIELPAKARLLSFAIDGLDQAQTGLSAPISAGLHRARIVWQDQARFPATPSLAAPRLQLGRQQVHWPGANWSIAIPARWRVASSAPS